MGHLEAYWRGKSRRSQEVGLLLSPRIINLQWKIGI